MSEFPREDWWSPIQDDIVEGSTSQQWEERVFQPSDALAFPAGRGTIVRRKGEGESTEGAKVISGGWDHEHCGLCNLTISACEGEEHVGFTDGFEWICRDCYSRFILPRVMYARGQQS
jgi:hypothetical protein